MWIDVGITKINHPPNHHNRRYKPFTHGWFMALFYLHCIVFDEIKKRYPSRSFPLHFPQTFDLFFSAQEFDSGGARAFFCHVMWIVSDQRTEDEMRRARMSVFGECCPKSGELLLSTVLVIHICKNDVYIYIYIYLYMYI